MNTRTFIAVVAACGAIAWATNGAAAPIVWYVDSGQDACTPVGCGGNGNTRTFNSEAGGLYSVTASAWANTDGPTNTQLQNANLQIYGGGLGVTNRDAGSNSGCPGSQVIKDCGEGGSPEHAIDNNGRVEGVLLQFNAQVILTDVMIGWRQTDSDVSLLAYTGIGAPTLGSLTWSSLTTNGWTFIDHYFDLHTDVWKPVNGAPSTQSSAYWLVSAFNPADLGAPPTSTTGATPGNDHIKLEGLRAVLPQLQVPEPGSLALFSLGALVAGAISRRRANG